VLFSFAREAAGASRARHSLRPLIFSGRTFKAKLARNARRDREAVWVHMVGCLKSEIGGRRVTRLQDAAANSTSSLESRGEKYVDRREIRGLQRG
jgi:hypothetical protein